jgi:hypothetical protein
VRTLEKVSLRDMDLASLAICTEALKPLTLRMQRANLEYLWDRFIIHPPYMKGIK